MSHAVLVKRTRKQVLRSKERNTVFNLVNFLKAKYSRLERFGFRMKLFILQAFRVQFSIFILNMLGTPFILSSKKGEELVAVNISK
jgi:hypothetical protein